MTPSPPRAIGRYLVVEELGHGGMGVVYRARDRQIGREVAIKVLRLDDAALRERFLREAAIIGRLKHPNIITIHDFGEHEGQPFIVMEFIDGKTLAAEIERAAAISLLRKLEIAQGLCAGLEYAHAHGIVHRDIKPANVMLEGQTVKLLDFGIARDDGATTQAAMTQSGGLIGTPNYMSPEQVEGRTVERRSDVFSTGLVLYELLSYQRAFKGDTAHAVMVAIARDTPTPLKEVYPDLDPQVEAIVARAIQKDPAKRYQTVAAMGVDVSKVLGRLRAGLGKTTFRGRLPIPQPPRPRGPEREVLEKRRAEVIEGYVRKAQRALDAGDLEAALGTSEEAVLFAPDEPRVHDLLDRVKEAIARRQAGVWLEEARALLDQGNLEEAAELVGRALEADPASEDGARLQATVEAARTRERERLSAMSAALSQARDSLANGRFETAIRAASEVLIHDPSHAEARDLSQRALKALEERRRREEAERTARAVVDQQRRVFAAGRHLEAIEALTRATPAHDVITTAIDEMRVELAAIERRALEEARRRQAEDEARKRQAEEAEASARALVDEQQRVFAAGRHRQAINALERATPPHAVITAALEAMRIAWAAIERRAKEEAARRERERAEAEQQRQAQQRWADGQVELARTAVRSRQFADAAEILRHLEQEVPHFPGSAELLAEALAGQAAAEAAARRAREITEKLGAAAAYVAQGQLDDAEALIADVLKMSPDHPDALARKDEIDAALDERRQKAQAAEAKEARRRAAAEARRQDEARRQAAAEAEARRASEIAEKLRAAAACVAQGQLDEAEALIADVLKLSPDHPDALERKYEIDAALDERRQAEAEEARKKAAAEARRKDEARRKAAAEAEARRASEIAEKLGAAAAFVAQGHLDEAEALVADVLGVSPDHPDALKRKYEIDAALETRRQQAKRNAETERIDPPRDLPLREEVQPIPLPPRPVPPPKPKQPVDSRLLAGVGLVVLVTVGALVWGLSGGGGGEDDRTTVASVSTTVPIVDSPSSVPVSSSVASTTVRATTTVPVTTSVSVRGLPPAPTSVAPAPTTVPPTTSTTPVTVSSIPATTIRTTSIPPTSIAPPRPTSVRPDEPAAIRVVIALWRDAMRNRSLDQVRRVWPTISGEQANALRTMFGDCTTLGVELPPEAAVRIDVSGVTASVSAAVTYVCKRERQAAPQTNNYVFQMRKEGADWRILNLTVVAR